MPRRAKRTTISGAPASPPVMPVDTVYGEGERALESQRRTPVPMTAGAPGPPLHAAGGGGAPAAPVDAQQAAMDAARAMDLGPSVLNTPSLRPNEQLTTGMDQAPAMPDPDPALWELRSLAQRFGYPDLVHFVQRREMEK